MPSSSDVGVVEAGLCVSWTRQVALSGGGRLNRVGGLLVALSAVPDQAQQVAVVERPVTEPDAAVVAVESLFVGAGWDPAFDLVAGAHPRLEEVLVDRGYQVVVERPGMVRRLEDLPVAADPRVEVVRAGVPQLAELATIQSRAFDLPPAVTTLLLPPSASSTPGLEVLVAIDRTGAVVGGLAVHVDAAIAGIVGAAVEPDVQGRGIGRCLTTAALARARDLGARVVWLQAAPAGLALWRGQGFVEVGTCRVWLSSHPGDSELRQGPRPTGL